MLVKIKHLREAISKCFNERLLHEGVIDNIKEKSSRSPEEWDEAFEKLQVLPQAKLKQYLTWLERVSRSNNEPLRDISPLVISFDDAKNRQKLKGKDADINSYKTPGDLHRKLEELPDDSKIGFKAASGDADKVYESDNFVILMPRSVNASCALGRGTTWCTARTKGENLFYSYIITNDVILYYILDKHDESKKWSIGVVYGKIRMPNQNDITVDQDNNKFEFSDAFGDEHKEMLAAIERHAAKIKEHPALVEIKKAVKSVPRFKKLVKGLRPAPYFSLLNQINDRYEDGGGYSMSMLTNAADYKLSDDVKSYAKSISMAKLEKLVLSKNDSDRMMVARHADATPDMLDKLADDSFFRVMGAVVRHRSTSDSTLMRLADAGDDFVRLELAGRKRLPHEILVKFSKDEVPKIRRHVIRSADVTPEILASMFDDENFNNRRLAKRKYNKITRSWEK